MNELVVKRQARKELQRQLDLATLPATKARRAMTANETLRFDRLIASAKTIDLQIEKLAAVQTAAAIVRSEPMTYSEHDGSTSYLKDLAAATVPQLGLDADSARQRLARHGREIEVEARRNPALANRLTAAQREARATNT